MSKVVALPATVPATILEPSSETWRLREGTCVLDGQTMRFSDRGATERAPANLPDNCYIFLNEDFYPKPRTGREELLGYFNVPDFLGNRTCTELNGYFGCRVTYNEKNQVESCSTWFRCLVKMVGKISERKPHEDGPEYVKDSDKNDGKDYSWYEMGFFTRWDHPDHCKFLCVDTPQTLARDLKKQSSVLKFNDPFAMHRLLIDQIILLYDISVWRVRDPVRVIEKSRQSVAKKFEEMHEMARHAIHVSEVLAVTIETMKGLQQHQNSIHQSLSDPLDKSYQEWTKYHTSFQSQMLKSLKLRSDSNLERLKNEITLVTEPHGSSAIINVRDGYESLQFQSFNTIARQDNTVIKSIALLTMIFLPATFVSAFFSMTFFTFDDIGNRGWGISNKIWLYWVVTIPSTVLIIITWRIWLSVPVQNFLAPFSWKKFFEKSKENVLGV